MTDIYFAYDVKIAHDAAMLKQGPLSQSLINGGEILIASKEYEDYADCEKALSDLMQSLTFIESKLSQQKHALIMKINPVIDSGEKDDAWDKDLIMQVYVINEKELNEASAVYSILGQIKTNGSIATSP